jgi:hypothetical protein
MVFLMHRVELAVSGQVRPCLLVLLLASMLFVGFTSFNVFSREIFWAVVPREIFRGVLG